MFPSLLSSSPRSGLAAGRWLVWVDGVGAWLLIAQNELTIGRASADSPLLRMRSNPSGHSSSGQDDEADLALTGNLSRMHVSIRRDDESFVLTPHANVSVDGRRVSRDVLLSDRSELMLNDSVRLLFELTTPLSLSARLTVLSDHRPKLSIQGAVLMAGTCLLGPGVENHIRCPAWSGSVVLAQTGSGLSVKSRLPLRSDGRELNGLTSLRDGQIVEGPELRFRMEQVRSRQVDRTGS